MRLKHLLIICALTLSFGAFAQSNKLVDQLTANLNEISLQQKVETQDLIDQFVNISERGKYIDVMVKQLYLNVIPPDSDVAEFIKAQKADGTWTDIDYADQQRSGWYPSMHTTRIQLLCMAYKTPTSKFYNTKELSSTIHKAMNFWFEAKLVCPNWWYNEIGVPKLLGPSFLLIKDEMSKEEIAKAVEVMDKARFRMTGQNKVWLAGNILMKALLVDDLKLAQQARDSIVSEIYMSTAEGLQPDYSFHQHGPMMQFGNYGLAYIGTMSYWARVFSGTPMTVDQKQLDLLSRYALDGIMWTIWKGNMDVNASARQVFTNSQQGKAHAVAVSMIDMIKVDSKKADNYKRYIYENQANIKANNTLTGNKYYWRSDYGVQRTPTWFASVRMHSSRTFGFEMTNRENLQGFHSADGALIVMVDGDEYRNIYPVWDWKKVPGTTVMDNTKELPYVSYENGQRSFNDEPFVGGASDGKLGVSAMVLNRKDGVQAHKAYFFTNNAVICLGAGISAEGGNVTTGIEQNIVKGDVTGDYQGNTATLDKGQSVRGDSSKWMHHNNTGYCLLEKANIVASNDMQNGNWSRIADFYKDRPESMQILKVFIDHGNSPKNATYAYAVLPTATASQTQAFSQNPNVKIMSNSTDCQAIEFNSGANIDAVFYKPAVVKLANSAQLSALTGGIMMIKKGKGSLVVTVADPTQTLDKFTFTLNGQVTASQNSGVSVKYNASKKVSEVTIALPTKEGLRGSSVTVNLKVKA